MVNAAKSTLESKKCLTPMFRVSFPAIFEPKAFQDQEAKYSVVMLYDKKIDLAKPADGQKLSLKHACYNAAVEKWGPKEKWPKNIRMPFRDGDEKEDTMGYAGCTYVSASSKTQPGLVGRDLCPILNAKDFYAGCYARAEVIAFAYDVAGNRGVGLALLNVQKWTDGEPFGGRVAPERAFTVIDDGSESAENYSNDVGF